MTNVESEGDSKVMKKDELRLRLNVQQVNDEDRSYRDLIELVDRKLSSRQPMDVEGKQRNSSEERKTEES